ncbi:MAG: ABC transporter permease [Lentihominibacter sp.]|jgi:ABC-2 type transport system permease protein
MRIRALILRIIIQLRHDKRTLALVLFVPILALSLVFFILDDSNVTYEIAIDSNDEAFAEALEDNDIINIEIVHLDKNPEQMVKEGSLAAVLYRGTDEELYVYLDGTDAGAASKAQAAIKSAFITVYRDQVKSDMDDYPGMELDIEEPEVMTEYVYGSADNSSFENIGVPMIGIIVFFFVYLIAGINFLGERRSGTLERMLATPIKRSEIVTGYTLGFCVLAIIQTLIISLFSVYALGLPVEGSLLLVLLINILTAICALTLGILLSTLADSEFQLIQFIPIVIIPQVFLCGLFHLSSGWQTVSRFVPLYYTTDALRSVMIKGLGLADIGSDVAVLLGLSIVFIIINILVLKRQRSV